MQKTEKGSLWAVLIFILVAVALIIGMLRGIPKYRIYAQTLKGEAALREAERTKKILIEEGKAELENAKLKAEAEIEKAKGVAEANRIIGDSLEGNDEYLRYLYIDKLDNTQSQVIYIPTEAGLPILEANRN